MPTASTPAPRYGVHHVQLARAAFAAIAALMITFSRDHSAAVGLSVFSGFAIATGLIWGLAAWLVFPRAQRAMAVSLAVVSIIAGMIAGILTLRSVSLFFVVVIAWLLVSGVIEAIAGARAVRQSRAMDAADGGRMPGVAGVDAADDGPVVGAAAMHSPRSEARDALTLGIITVLFGVGMLFVPWDYTLQYTVPEAPGTFTLSGIIIGVGVFGAYAAVVAVYLAIAGFSPRRALTSEPATAPAASPSRAEESA